MLNRPGASPNIRRLLDWSLSFTDIYQIISRIFGLQSSKTQVLKRLFIILNAKPLLENPYDRICD